MGWLSYLQIGSWFFILMTNDILSFQFCFSVHFSFVVTTTMCNIYRYTFVLRADKCEPGHCAFESAGLCVGSYQGNWHLCARTLYINRVHGQEAWRRKGRSFQNPGSCLFTTSQTFLFKVFLWAVLSWCFYEDEVLPVIV